MPRRDARARRAPRDADRRRQVALLPAPRPRARRHDARRQPAHRADGGPGREARRVRPRAERIHSGRDRASVARRVSRLPRRRRSTSSSSRPSASGCPAFRRCSRDDRRRSSRSTRRTASRSGGTTSGPTTACSASGSRSCAPRPSSRSPRRRRRPCRTTSSTQLGLDRAQRVHSRLPPHEHRRRGGRDEPRRAAPTPCSSCSRDPARRPAIVYAPTRREAEPLAQDALGAHARRRRTTRGCRPPSAREAQRPRSSPASSRSSSRRSRSAWASTRPTCARSSTRRCRRRSRATTRRSAAPAATGRRRARCSSTRSSTGRRTSSSTSATTPSAASLRAIFEKLGDAPIAKDALASLGWTLARGVREGAREALAPRRRARRPRRVDSSRRSPGTPSRTSASARTASSSSRAMRRYADKSACRMLQLVEHFGDQNDAGAPVRAVRRLRAGSVRRSGAPDAEHDGEGRGGARLAFAFGARRGRRSDRFIVSCSRRATSTVVRSSTSSRAWCVLRCCDWRTTRS